MWGVYRVQYEAFDYNHSGSVTVKARSPEEAEKKMQKKMQHFDLVEMMDVEVLG